jgi:hypothetical protein
MSLKKAIFLEKELPPLTVYSSELFGYPVRYRIISEDGNRASHFSPIFNIVANYFFERPFGRLVSDIAIIRQGPIINVFWESVSVKDKATGSEIKKASSYDLWIRWSKGESNAEWLPAERVEGAQQGFYIPPSYVLEDGTTIQEEPNRLSVEIYIRATKQSRNNAPLLVYEALNVDITPPVPPPSN